MSLFTQRLFTPPSSRSHPSSSHSSLASALSSHRLILLIPFALYRCWKRFLSIVLIVCSIRRPSPVSSSFRSNGVQASRRRFLRGRQLTNVSHLVSFRSFVNSLAQLKLCRSTLLLPTDCSPRDTTLGKSASRQANSVIVIVFRRISSFLSHVCLLFFTLTCL